MLYLCGRLRSDGAQGKKDLLLRHDQLFDETAAGCVGVVVRVEHKELENSGSKITFFVVLFDSEVIVNWL